MKGSMRAATALGIGYLLGRHRRFRAAAVLAAATAAGGSTVGGMALRRGMKALGSADAVGKVAPQFGEIAQTVRGDLLTAGKAAATTAVSSRVDSLTDSIHERAERVRNPGAAVAEGAAAARDTGERAGSAARTAGGRAGSAARGTTRRVTGRGTRDTGEASDEAAEETETDETETEETANEDYEDQADQADQGAPTPTPTSARSRHAPPAKRRSPVTRTGR